MKSKWFVFPAVGILLILPAFSGESLCKSEYLMYINVSTELQSDVLLPCSFNPALLGSNETADIAAVWSQRNTTSRHDLLEIRLKGEVRPWNNNKGGRIKAFPELSESGNFSIVLEKVQPYDLGLYRCDLFNGSSCRIAYQEIQLSLMVHHSSRLLWSVVGAFAGGIVLLAVLTAYLLHAKRRENIIATETCYENVVGAIAHTDRGSKSLENPVYDTFCQLESNNCAREEEGVSSDTPVYATVKKGKIVNST